jgi:hypothetical protein
VPGIRYSKQCKVAQVNGSVLGISTESSAACYLKGSVLGSRYREQYKVAYERTSTGQQVQGAVLGSICKDQC